LVIATGKEPVLPNPNIALSVPYTAAASQNLSLPTPVVSVATTPKLDTRLVIEVAPPPPIIPNPNIALVVIISPVL
jgi:hypothetical protein